MNAAMTLDYDRYLHHLDAYDMPEDQKRELIAVVYEFMEGFVDSAFGVHPVQTSMNAAANRIRKSPGGIVGLSNENIRRKFQRAASARQKDQP